MNELILYKEIIASTLVLIINVVVFEYFKRIFSLSNNNNQPLFNYLLKSWFETLSWFLLQLRNRNKVELPRFMAGVLLVVFSILSILGSLYKDLIYQEGHVWYSLGCLLINYIAYTLFVFSKGEMKNKDYTSLNIILSFAVLFIHIILNMVFKEYSIIGSLLSLLVCVFSISNLVKDIILTKRNSVESLFISCFYTSSLFLLLGFFNKKEMLLNLSEFRIEQNLLVIIIGLCFSYLLNKKIKINEIIKTKYSVKLFVFTSNIVVLVRVVLWKI
jgi:hypothetical protein